MKKYALYDERMEHDACGIGAAVNIDGHKDHQTISDALTIVERLKHRAGRDAEGATGDGVGILTQIPHALFEAWAKENGVCLGDAGDYGVGMLFLPKEQSSFSEAVRLFESIARSQGFAFLLWREVPVCPDILGKGALEAMPRIGQAFVARPDAVARGLPFDRELYALRRAFEKACPDTYVCSLSSRTIVYKGMMLVDQLRLFYPDLQNERYQSALALVHSRFSTNTDPGWKRAHPNRVLLHNGEINTIRGNVDRMLAREETMRSPVLGDKMKDVLPVVAEQGSDSAMLDNALEFMMMNGMPLPLAVMAAIPEPWRNESGVSRARRDLYHYYSTMLEPWDGPASILFTDGEIVGAVLDRNGLRPSRYCFTKDNRLILSSEVGVLDLPPESVIKRSRLTAGKMLLIDTEAGRVIDDDELKENYARRNPYGEWLDAGILKLDKLPTPMARVPVCDQATRERLMKAFGYTNEDVIDVILPMAKNCAEPIGAMGADVPLAALSGTHPPLSHYFKQRFAQVTNPPIDALREKIVTDPTVYVGDDGNLLIDSPDNCAVLELDSPILTGVELLKIKRMTREGFRVETVSLLYERGTALKKAVDRLLEACDQAYLGGVNVLILSDRGVDETHCAIPSLLAVSSLEQHLVRTKKRTAVSVILESAEPRCVHDFALLLGYGARAVNPYLAHECVVALCDQNRLQKETHEAIDDYDAAVLSGIVKIASKMGISTLQSYQSAQIFESIGIDSDIIERYFTNTPCRAGGVGLNRIEADVIYCHDNAFAQGHQAPDTVGYHRLRTGESAEKHLYSPGVIDALQQATWTNDAEKYKEYSSLVQAEGVTLRSLLEFRFDECRAVPLGEVEPASEIVKRFKTGAMSYGSISQEAHECMAVAMNRLGGKSNSGEGGEDAARFGTERNSAIKQVASGRFGVTAEYLLSAMEIQIKMAQGAKPGEGGHLPGKKVSPQIAKTRCSTSGVSLISPPPHHDIYSIEDLAELIYDLKCVGNEADISVKLVSETGVGTVASGVAKAGARVVLISGGDGGTGAAPLSSIHHAGLPWEFGLAEAHQTLCKNNLRQMVSLETDGKLMTGRDVAVALLLGAEQFGFATAPLVTMGCRMMRVCNLDTCPMGIATQNPELRKRFLGKPEYIERFMLFVAEELRGIMAKLGARTVDELVGRSDLLKMKDDCPLDLSGVLSFAGNRPFEPSKAYDFKLSERADAKMLSSLKQKRVVDIKVGNTDRAFGTLAGAALLRQTGGMEEGAYNISAQGSGGQSFGAFLPRGVTLTLTGEANDYLGKGLSGGIIAVSPPKGAYLPSGDALIGNVALYGATSGYAFIAGAAGERFCVRNSGARAVVEGVGDHGCEYMTGGRVVILGDTGRNFAAGMSGGVAYVLDQRHDLYLRLNKDMVLLEKVEQPEDIEELRNLISRHVGMTSSPHAAELLRRFDQALPDFKKIIPIEYKRATRG